VGLPKLWGDSIMATKHKPHVQFWQKIICPCGWESDIWRSDSAGKSSSWNDYKRHKAEHLTAKPKMIGLVRMTCDCGWRSGRFRSDSAGMKDAWQEYRLHKENE